MEDSNEMFKIVVPMLMKRQFFRKLFPIPEILAGKKDRICYFRIQYNVIT